MLSGFSYPRTRSPLKQKPSGFWQRFQRDQLRGHPTTFLYGVKLKNQRRGNGLYFFARSLRGRECTVSAFLLPCMRPRCKLSATQRTSTWPRPPGAFFPESLLLAKPAGNLYYPCMKISEKIKQAIRRELAAAGGRARAKKYDHRTLSKWGAKGGRPRKQKDGAR